MECFGELRKLKLESLVLQAFRHNVPTVEGEVWIGAKHQWGSDSNHPGKGWQADRNSDSASQFSHEGML